MSDADFEDVPRCDVVLVPGGPGVDAAANDTRLFSWLKAVDETSVWTTSLCTGALLLGAAGLLRGRQVTTHWLSVDRLTGHGATWDPSRVVTDGKFRIDMALTLAAHLAGDDVAQAIQLSIEYDP